MASGRTGLEELEDEITCSLCLLIFTEPRKLPCDHVFCTGCLEKMVNYRKDNTIECPKCRKVSQIPHGQVSKFPVAFQFNRLIGLHATLIEKLRHASVSSIPELSPNLCEEHTTQALEMFCETCDEQICRDCVLKGKHKDHKTNYIERVAARVRGELEGFSVPLKEMERKVSVALEMVRKKQAEIRSHGDLLQETIDIAYAEIITKLQQEKESLEREAASKIQEKLRNIGQQVENIQDSKSELQTAISLIETAKQTTPDLELIASQTEIKSKIKMVETNFTSLNLKPCEGADIGIETSTAEAHANIWRENSYIFSLADPHKCKVAGSPLNCLETNTRGIIYVKLLDTRGYSCTGRQSLNVQLNRIIDNTVGNIQISDHGAGMYEIAIQVATRGRYKLSVEVNGAHIANSPYEILASKPPTQIHTPLKKIDNLKSPSGLSYSMGKLIVSNHDHDQLTVINQQGEGEVIKLPAKFPTGATYDKDGNLYVCTAGDSRLHKFDKSGQRVKSTTTGQFKFPNGLILSDESKLYVCDSQRDRIIIFDTDLNYCDSITTKTVKSKIECRPVDIDKDTNGNFYITEHGNQRILILNSLGEQIHTISTRRNSSLLHNTSFKPQPNQERLSKPAGIKVFGENVYVTDWESNCVFVFSIEGSLVTSFGGDILRQPEGLTIDDDGYIYVAHSRNEVVVF